MTSTHKNHISINQRMRFPIFTKLNQVSRHCWLRKWDLLSDLRDEEEDADAVGSARSPRNEKRTMKWSGMKLIFFPYFNFSAKRPVKQNWCFMINSWILDQFWPSELILVTMKFLFSNFFDMAFTLNFVLKWIILCDQIQLVDCIIINLPALFVFMQNVSEHFSLRSWDVLFFLTYQHTTTLFPKQNYVFVKKILK